jgi:hypothetical protein
MWDNGVIAGCKNAKLWLENFAHSTCSGAVLLQHNILASNAKNRVTSTGHIFQTVAENPGLCYI